MYEVKVHSSDGWTVPIDRDEVETKLIQVNWTKRVKYAQITSSRIQRNRANMDVFKEYIHHGYPVHLYVYSGHQPYFREIISPNN